MPSSNPPSHALAELGKLDRYAGMEFIKPTSKLNRRYVGPGAEFNTGEYETKKVVIRDARNHDEHFSIDTTGFFLAKHQSKVCSSREALFWNISCRDIYRSRSSY